MSKKTIPSPPCPNRRVPLPEEKPKSTLEDKEAQRRIKEIMSDPSYIEADQDAEFLNEDDTRGVRLQVDYLKAELLINKHDIKGTIVVFGSTRLNEKISLERDLDKLKIAHDLNPTDEEIIYRIQTTQRLLAKSSYYDMAREFGSLVANSSAIPQLNKTVIVTGGGPGIMEAANRGAHDARGKSIGLNINLPHEQFPNPYITPGLCFRFHYFSTRKLHFLKRAKALVAFPGGYGTLDEIFETLTLIQTRTIKPVPVILVGESYWRQAINIEFLAQEGVIDKEDTELFWYAESAQDIWDTICNWHLANGDPL